VIPRTVEAVRSGDRPTGNTASADQSAAGPEVTGQLEDIGAGPSVPPVQPAAGDPGVTRPDEPPDHDGTAREDPHEPDAREPAAAGSDPVAADASAESPESSPESSGEPSGPGKRGLRPGRSRHRSGPAATRASAGLVSLRWLRPSLRRGGRPAKHPDLGGLGFARITVLPTILVTAWLLAGLPLLLAGVFVPGPELLITIAMAVTLTAGLRRLPAAWPRALPGAARGPRREARWPAWWGLAGTVVVAAGFALWQFWFNSESVIVLRGPGAYLQTGYWIAQHGSLPIPQSLSAFGGAHPGLGFSSTGFFTHGTSVVPGLLSGLPLLLAGAFWVHGTAAAAAMGPILGGLAMLAFGGLAGRLAGPQWAPAAALVLGFTLPEQYTSRASFSETAAQILLFGGLSLVVDALTISRAGHGPSPRGRLAPPTAGAEDAKRGMNRWAARLRRLDQLAPHWPLMLLGGLALGMTALVRFDGLLWVLPAIPFIGILLARGRSATALSFGIGLVVGAGYGLADAYLMARPFVDSLRPLPELTGLLAAWLAAMTLAVVELLRLPGFRRRLRSLLDRRPVRWLPEAGGVLAVAALIGLAIRPYLQVVRGPSTGAAADYVASLQRLGNLVVDPGRLYAEDTLYWVVWYVGLPAVLLGGFGLALLVRRCLRGLVTRRDPSGAARIWGLPLAVICWGAAAVLWNPETVPDQPWASRRLVPLVLPGLILFAAWAAAWLRGRARSRGAGRTAATLVAACCVVALLVPTVATTFGLGLTHSGPQAALRPSANGPALKRTGQGETGALARLCSAIGPSAVVVIVDRPIAEEFTQTIRGMCGVPVGWVTAQQSSDLSAVLNGIERTGRRPVLLAARPSELYNYGGTPVQVLNLTTSQDPHMLTQPPSSLSTQHYAIWMSAFGPTGQGV